MTDSSDAKPDWATDWQDRTDALIIARAQAIDVYAGLERQMANLFSQLLNIEQELGALVFYRIVASRSRNAMMEDLLARKHPDYKKYWEGLFRLITNLDTKRNQIVHWHMAGIKEPALSHPKHFFWEDGGIPEVTIDSILDFMNRAEFAAKSVNVFWLMADRINKPWHDIFLQAPIYPIPAGHPLSRWTKGWQIQPPTSPA